MWLHLKCDYRFLPIPCNFAKVMTPSQISHQLHLHYYSGGVVGVWNLTSSFGISWLFDALHCLNILDLHCVTEGHFHPPLYARGSPRQMSKPPWTVWILSPQLSAVQHFLLWQEMFSAFPLSHCSKTGHTPGCFCFTYPICPCQFGSDGWRFIITLQRQIERFPCRTFHHFCVCGSMCPGSNQKQDTCTLGEELARLWLIRELGESPIFQIRIFWRFTLSTKTCFRIYTSYLLANEC